MANLGDFNPFRILPENLMLKVLLYTFEKDAKSGFEHFMDYDAVNKKLRESISNEDNWDFIVNSTPPEFNVELIASLKNNKIKTKEGRYQVGICLLLLKFIYGRVKPYPDDDYLLNEYDHYFNALTHINTHFKEYPGVLYAASYVSFALAKRFLTMRRNKEEMRSRGGILYLLALDCAILSNNLDHPLAKLFLDDMNIQLARQNINVKKYVKGTVPKLPAVKIDEALQVLSPKKKLDFSGFSDEDHEMIIVIWQKLMIENLYRARDLFKFAVNYDMVRPLTEYFYHCFSKNHFHRHVLAYNPMFVLSDRKENILYLLRQYSVKDLITLHQAFKVYYPKPDSVLLSTLLKVSVSELSSMSELINHVLTLPNCGTRGWQINFLDAYRDAIDDGSLKEVSAAQMKMVLYYFKLVDRAGELAIIVDRDAYLLGKIMHRQDDKIHNGAIAVVKQLMRLSSFDPLGTLNQQEILLTCLYTHSDILYELNISEENDYDRVASVIIEAYNKFVATPANEANSAQVFVAEFLKRNDEKIKELKLVLNDEFKSLGLRA